MNEGQKVAYVRVSTVEQNEGRQMEALKTYGINRTFMEKASAKDTNRPYLKEMLDYVRDGDIIYILDFSRLARSTKDLLEIVEQLKSKGVKLVSLKENLDTDTPAGKMMLTMLAAINQFERENLLERQREGIILAKRAGKYKGRKRIIPPENFEDVFTRWEKREFTGRQAMKELKLKPNTFYKLLTEWRDKKGLGENMATRRGNGEGNIYKKRGYWEARITKGYDKNGVQAFKYFSSKSRSELVKKLDNYKVELQKGSYLEPSKLTVGDWLEMFYLSHIVDRVKISTRVNDESIIKHHLKPNIGRIKLSELKGYNVQKLYNQMLISGRVDGKGGLNPKTIRNIHLTLHKALEQAVKDDLIIKPTKKRYFAKNAKKEIEVLTPEEQKRLNTVCFEHPWGMAVLLTLYTGMRMGEVLGLTWDNVDFENNKIKVAKQLGRLKDYGKDAKAKTKLFLRNETKTSSSNRTIYIAPVFIDKLKEHKLKQEIESKKWGKGYHNLNMVFCREDGQFIDPGTFRGVYLDTLETAGIGHKTFHALRHTFATRALESNTNIKVVSEILGHASIQITLDTYSHVSEELQQDAMQKIATNFFAA